MTEISSISESTSSPEIVVEQPNQVTDAVTGRIWYCNGMTTSEELALSHARTITALTGIDVELHYNNTTSYERALKITGKLGLGSLAVVFGLIARSRLVGRVIGLVGLSAFISGFFDLNQIDKEKHILAQILANRVSAYLEAHPLHHITLIFHSQGADIGHRALEKLIVYKDRINVVTIGGMVDIPDSLARRVVNFVNDNDMIAYLAKTLFDPKSGTKTKVQIKDKNSAYIECHYSTDYLGRPQVKEAILELAKMRPAP